jgi:hypothetical protein
LFSSFTKGLSVIENEKEHFSRWREFLLICSIPSFVALFGLLFMPESPRYLLEAGREVEAMLVYQVCMPILFLILYHWKYYLSITYY